MLRGRCVVGQHGDQDRVVGELLGYGRRGGDEGAPTVRVHVTGRIVDARQASDLIGKLSGKAYWRKLFVRKDRVPLDEARRRCAKIIATGGMPSLFDARLNPINGA